MSDKNLLQSQNLIPEDVWESFLWFVDKDDLCLTIDCGNPSTRRLVELWYKQGESLIQDYEQNKIQCEEFDEKQGESLIQDYEQNKIQCEEFDEDESEVDHD